MTLILTIANENGVHQTSDYRLTNLAGKTVSSDVGTKQLERTLIGLVVRVAFSGVAQLVRGPSTVDWLNDELSSLPNPTDFKTLCARLVHRCDAEIGSKVAVGSKSVLTVLMAVAENGKPFRVVRISNSDFTKQHRVRQKKFIKQVRTVKRPFYLIDPAPDQLLTQEEKDRLDSLSRAIDKAPKDIRDELAKINAEAAKRSTGLVSEGCWAGSLFKERGGDQLTCQMINVGESPGMLKFTGSDAERKLMEEAMERVRKETGWEAVGVRQSVTGSIGRAPSKPKGT